MTRRLYLAVVLALLGGLLLAAGAPGQPATPALTAIGEPDTFIDSGPSNLSKSPTATFTFHSDDPLAFGFTCYLDGVALGTCASPSTYTGLADGSHTFDVQAMGLLGTDPTPAHAAWTIDTVAPETTITSPPIGTTSSSSATFTFTSSEPGSTFRCQRNGHTPIYPCPSPKTYTALKDGTHTFKVWARDPSGNEDPTAASQTWRVDSTAPQTMMTSGPTGTTSSTSATFTFSSSEPGSTFECRRNLDAFTACTSPLTYSDLADGTYTFEVRATDTSGFTDPSPATATWTVASSSTGVAPVGGLRAVAGDHRVRLNWTNPTGIGLAKIEVRRGSTRLLVYRGLGTEFVDTHVFNGRTYKYSVVVFDDLGRASPAAGVFALPHGKLVAPRDGTRVRGAPLLRWLPRARATYYNVQLYRNGKKLLSRWPAGARFQLRTQWRYRGRLYRLRDGRYLWYVFPGFGKKTANRYGNVMGHSTFFKR
jgi:hypothetical protein